jgi:hypothetical protein
VFSSFQEFLKNILSEKQQLPLNEQQRHELEKLITKERSIPPKVAVIGKAGVGKTTTVNSLFNASLKVSHSIAGTREAQMKEFELAGGGKLNIVDMPGLGESIETDEKYEKIYREILPTVDVILYVVQANERVLAEDQRILKEVVINSMPEVKSRIVIGLNQVDKIGPGEWNKRLNLPSPEQEQSIERRCSDIISKLSAVTGITREQIKYYSATQRYCLYELLTAVVNATGDLGWKMPIQPKDWAELADPEVQAFIAKNRR